MSQPVSLARVYRGPAIIGVLLALGLSLALFGDGLWDVSAWVLLAIPLLLLVSFLLRGSPDRQTQKP